MTAKTKKKHPKVQCVRCGNCCRIPEIPITHKDLSRLAEATGKPANRIVRFCPISEMEYDPDSGMWISFKSGKRAMVLRKKSGRCQFQTPKRTCAAYEARPQTCRTFPYSVDFQGAKNDMAPDISLNTVLACNAEKCSAIDVDNLLNNVRKENKEDRGYHKLIKKWNDSPNKGGTADFLAFIGF
jgi:Fe-S-cluster containining protein